MRFRFHAGIILVLAAALAGCENATPAPEIYDKDVADVTRDRRQSTIGDLFEADRLEEDSGGNLAVNKYLWRASLDTLAFLPLASTDPFSGVIATDWGVSAQAPEERYKVTAYVTSPKLEAQSLRVAVYREVLKDGVWTSAPVSPETPRKLEDSILTRARQIKVAELEADRAT